MDRRAKLRRRCPFGGLNGASPGLFSPGADTLAPNMRAHQQAQPAAVLWEKVPYHVAQAYWAASQVVPLAESFSTMPWASKALRMRSASAQSLAALAAARAAICASI